MEIEIDICVSDTLKIKTDRESGLTRVIARYSGNSVEIIMYNDEFQKLKESWEKKR